jgi:transcriptional regulator with XRE-family HTH domain
MRAMTAVHPLETYRKDKALSRSAVATLFDVDRTTIWRWENGTRIPDRDQLRKVAAITGAPIDDLLEFGRAAGKRSAA